MLCKTLKRYVFSTEILTYPINTILPTSRARGWPTTVTATNTIKYV